MIGKALGYLLLSFLVLLLSPILAFWLGLEWGIEGNFSWKGYWITVCRVLFWHNDGNLKEAFKRELLLLS
jgi:hypothetical protein